MREREKEETRKENPLGSSNSATWSYGTNKLNNSYPYFKVQEFSVWTHWEKMGQPTGRRCVLGEERSGGDGTELQPSPLKPHPEHPACWTSQQLTVEIISQERTDLHLVPLSTRCLEPSVQEEAWRCQSQPRSQLCQVKSSHPSRHKLNFSSSLVKTPTPPTPSSQGSLSCLKPL